MGLRVAAHDGEIVGRRGVVARAHVRHRVRRLEQHLDLAERRLLDKPAAHDLFFLGHSGARPQDANPEPMNTGLWNMASGLGPVDRPGMTGLIAIYSNPGGWRSCQSVAAW